MAVESGIPIANSLIGLFSLKPIDLVAQQSFAELFRQEVTRYSTVAVALIIYLIVADSLFLAGTLRFVAKGKISAYFRLLKNLGLVIALPPISLALAAPAAHEPGCIYSGCRWPAWADRRCLDNGLPHRQSRRETPRYEGHRLTNLSVGTG